MILMALSISFFGVFPDYNAKIREVSIYRNFFDLICKFAYFFLLSSFISSMILIISC